MPIATSPSAIPRPVTLVKMEDRKRPAVSSVDDVAPPSKRLNINGAGKSKDDSGDKGEDAWIEVCQEVTRPSPLCLICDTAPSHLEHVFSIRDELPAAVYLMYRVSHT